MIAYSSLPQDDYDFDGMPDVRGLPLSRLIERHRPRPEPPPIEQMPWPGFAVVGLVALTLGYFFLDRFLNRLNPFFATEPGPPPAHVVERPPVVREYVPPPTSPRDARPKIRLTAPPFPGRKFSDDPNDSVPREAVRRALGTNR